MWAPGRARTDGVGDSEEVDLGLIRSYDNNVFGGNLIQFVMYYECA